MKDGNEIVQYEVTSRDPLTLGVIFLDFDSGEIDKTVNAFCQVWTYLGFLPNAFWKNFKI